MPNVRQTLHHESLNSRIRARGFALSARARGFVMLQMIAGAAMAAVLVGMLGYTLISMVKSGSNAQRASDTRDLLRQAAYTLTVAAVNADADDAREPPAGTDYTPGAATESPSATETYPTYPSPSSNKEGWYIPKASAAPKLDAWGSYLKYCVWDNGSTNTSTGRKSGDATATYVSAVAFAVISAGPDKMMQTTCAQAKAGTPQGDDVVRAMTNSQIVQGVGGTAYLGDAVADVTALGALPAVQPGQMRTDLSTGTVYINRTGGAGIANWLPISGGGGGTVSGVIRPRVVSQDEVFILNTPRTINLTTDMYQPGMQLQGLPGGYIQGSPTVTPGFSAGSLVSQTVSIPITPPNVLSPKTTVYFGASSSDVANTNNWQGSLSFQTTDYIPTTTAYTTLATTYPSNGTAIVGDATKWRVVSVPPGTNKCSIFAIGASGGAGNPASWPSGAGGYSHFTWDCSGDVNKKLLIATGQGGDAKASTIGAGYGGFPRGGNGVLASSPTMALGGGGRSEVRIAASFSGATPTAAEIQGATVLVVAGGGGAGWNSSGTTRLGGGGGLTGGGPAAPSSTGGGGTQVAGGSAGSSSGSSAGVKFGGGSGPTSSYASGGGDGWYGGGGAGGSSSAGGGSGYVADGNNGSTAYPGVLTSESGTYSNNNGLVNAQATTDYNNKFSAAGIDITQYGKAPTGSVEKPGLNGIVIVKFEM